MDTERVAQATIYVESQATLKTLGSCFAKSSLEEGCQRAIKKIINLRWVPGHKDVISNEIARKLARQGLAIYYQSTDLH